MCLAVPGKVIKIEGRKATVEYPGQSRLALVAEVEPRVGEMVMVQMGVVVKVLDPSEAKATTEAWGEVERKQGK